MKDNTNLQILKISPFWEDFKKALWLENHEKDLDPKQTSEDFDVYHQTGWRAEYS
ncbi:MAG TPA: hypothetical protein VJ772_01825 [Nitrososphaeraceae archaeon]|nr:hypothetical protein [Nitrososphaeraceae archaeon]